jgi:hypothetical protein
MCPDVFPLLYMRRHLSPILALFEYIYIFAKPKKYLGCFEQNFGRSSAQRFDKDDNKTELRPKIMM